MSPSELKDALQEGCGEHQKNQGSVISLSELESLAKKLAKLIQEQRLGTQAPLHLILKGPLGAGKTTFVCSLAKALQVKSDTIQSPTYSYLHAYEEQSPAFYHFDLYRLKDENDFEQMGFDEYFEKAGICCVEWPERIESLFPKLLSPYHLFFEFSHLDENSRNLKLSVAA